MPFVYCHNCQAQFGVPANTGECPACGGGFVEEVPAQVWRTCYPTHLCQLYISRAGHLQLPDLPPQGLHKQPPCTRLSPTPSPPDGAFIFPTWPLPAPRQAQPAGPAAGGAAAGGGHSYTRTFSLPGGGRGTVFVSTGGPPGVGAGHPLAGLHGMGPGDPFVTQVLEAMLGGGFLHPGMAGMGPGGAFAG